MRNKKTGLEMYDKSLWIWIKSSKSNWGMVLFMVLLQIAATINGIMTGETYLIWGFCWAIPLAIWYQWRNWREAKRGETS